MKPCVILICVLFAFELKADEQFTRTVQPFLKTYCVSCHGPEKVKGKIRVDDLDASMTGRKQVELWAQTLEALEFGEMPSDKAEKFPTKDEVRAVTQWISKALTRQGLSVSNKKDREGYGNLVSHELLFSPAESK